VITFQASHHTANSQLDNHLYISSVVAHLYFEYCLKTALHLIASTLFVDTGTFLPYLSYRSNA
jgi:hypothetical protein